MTLSRWSNRSALCSGRPRSLVNAACVEHANVAFERDTADKVWHAVARVPVRAGDAVLASYPIPNCVCCVPGCRCELADRV